MWIKTDKHKKKFLHIENLSINVKKSIIKEKETEFETEGINQTRYYVYCTIKSQVRIVAPFTDKISEIKRKVIIAEAVIVGKVPDNYVMVPEENILDAIE